jgi:alkaline phosphatase D
VNPIRIHRRTFLRWAAVASAGIWLAGCDSVPDRPFVARPEDPQRFPAGVQAGGATAEGALLWTLVPDGAPVVLRIWPEANPLDAPPMMEIAATPGSGGYVHVSVGALAAGTWWRYAFYDDAAGVRSRAGRFRTAFAPGVLAPLRVGATACTAYGRRPFPALSRMAAAELDVFCHLGDMSYNDTSRTLGEYRASWQALIAQPDYQALLSQVGTYQTWDDHEIADDADLYDASMAAQIIAAKQAFFESLPVPHRTEPGAGALGGDEVYWGSYRWGATAEFFVVDSRLERAPETRETEAARYLGDKQFAWLEAALLESPCHFKIVLNSVPIATLPPVWAGEADRWAGYPAQREALLDHLTEAGVRNVWFLSGDFHLGAVWRVEPTGPRSAMWEILCGPGGSSPSKRMMLANSSPQAHALFFPEGRVEHSNAGWATTVLDFDPAADAVRVRFEDHETGASLYDAVLRAETA